MKVSLIVTCYNQESYVKETLDSIKKQTFSDWECIIVDDGSTDNSANIIKKNIEHDCRFQYFHQPNQGVCMARNNAICKATGIYVLCIDADDLISCEYLELCVKELDSDDSIALVACNYKKFGRRHKSVVLEPYSIEKLMGHNLFVNCCMFRRKDFDKIGGFNLNMNKGLEDWDFWLSLLQEGGKVKYLQGFHFFYRIRRKSRNQKTKSKQSLLLLRKQIWENHHKLYSSIYSTPYYSEEYIRISRSIEYKLGKVLFKPIRLILGMIGM